MSTPTCKPILFSGPMIRALLGGVKTQTRRAVKPQPPAMATNVQLAGDQVVCCRSFGGPIEGIATCPYGDVGSLLWIREAHSLHKGLSALAKVHDATYCCFPDGSQSFKSGKYYHHDKPVTGSYPIGHRWRPSIFMPRWASRLTLRIASVRVERLHDISEADAIAEGAREAIGERDGRGYDNDMESWCRWTRRIDPHASGGTARGAFAALWERINGEGSWAVNPFVWCVSFERVEQSEVKS